RTSRRFHSRGRRSDYCATFTVDFQTVTDMSETIKRRERDAVLQSLQAGLVPKQGLHLIQVGRKQEVSAILSDLERIENGGSAFRIVIGRFGSGKSFFVNLVRT